MQDTQMLKREIITVLDSLPEDGINLLAEFASFLRSKYVGGRNNDSTKEQADTEVITLANATQIQHRTARISSPRLVNPNQVSDFELEVIQEPFGDEV